ncbi:ankyrin repeat-containing domain protein [Boeremia exigua]|uniref:ankyrin repeat-containing domain protein n=1 Tax=Boeremia exigua TaxID=749465 RepID=UPI001E8CF752|nr:ankyrin repeat-containing domain protein [Boeremia exigua]KAH6618650.1 ankyrin repeat-containing domain protein [Boeremia exigua]
MHKMDHEEFTSDSSSPREEIPHDAQAAQVSNSTGSSLLPTNEIPEAQALLLDRTTRELEQLCSKNIEVQTIKAHLESWMVGSNSTKLQPNLLIRLNSSGALQYAVKNQRKDVVRVLLNYDLVPSERSISAALDHVNNTGDTSMLQLLIDDGWDINQLYNRSRPSIMSVVVGDVNLVKWCLSLGGDPNAVSPSGMSVLHRAACIGTIASLEALLAAGGQIQSPCHSDDIVAHAASVHDESYNRIPVIQYLLDRGADIDAYYAQRHDPRETSGLQLWIGTQTALHIAIERDSRDLVEFLIQKGADPSKRMWNYSTVCVLLEEWKGRSGWEEHIQWLDAISYARFLGREGIVNFLQGS